MDVIKGRIVNCFSSFHSFYYSSLHLRPIIVNYFSYFSTRIWLKISRDNRLLPTGIASKQFNHLLYRWKHAWYHNYKVELEYPKKSSHPWPNIKFAWFYELVDCHRFNFFSKQVDWTSNFQLSEADNGLLLKFTSKVQVITTLSIKVWVKRDWFFVTLWKMMILKMSLCLPLDW